MTDPTPARYGPPLTPAERRGRIIDLYDLALTAEQLADSEFHVESVDGPCKRCARLEAIRIDLGIERR